MKKRNAIVINPISSSMNILIYYKKLGFNPIVLESHNLEEDIACTHDHFVSYYNEYNMLPGKDFTVIQVDNDFSKTLEEVKKLDPIIILPGSDMGIMLAAKLSLSLGLTCVPSSSFKVLKDKSNQQLALKNAGLRYIKSIIAKTPEDAYKLFDETPAHKIVVKPNDGVGSFGVSICDTKDKIKNAVERITKADPNKFNFLQIGHDALCQEYIGGEEFIIDIIVSNGNPVCCFASKYKKVIISSRSLTPIYDSERYVDYDDPKVKQLIDYAFNVVKALGITYGSVHGEYKFDEKGPVLIEANCRLDGGCRRDIWYKKVSGINHALILIYAHLYPKKFARLPRIIKCKVPFITKMLIINKELNVKYPDFKNGLKGMSSYVTSSANGCSGNCVFPITVDLETFGGYIFLANKDADKLEKDYQEIKKIEDTDIERLFILNNDK